MEKYSSYTLNLNYIWMELAVVEEKALDGNYGEALAAAYRILVAIGKATGAKKLVPVKWAHIYGVNYNTIGYGGMRFLEKFSTAEVRGKDYNKLNRILQEQT